jgi:hypothetical protein
VTKRCGCTSMTCGLGAHSYDYAGHQIGSTDAELSRCDLAVETRSLNGCAGVDAGRYFTKYFVKAPPA